MKSTDGFLLYFLFAPNKRRVSNALFPLNSVAFFFSFHFGEIGIRSTQLEHRPQHTCIAMNSINAIVCVNAKQSSADSERLTSLEIERVMDNGFD